MRTPRQKEPRQERETAKNWWDETVWYVWTPDDMVLTLPAGSDEFAFSRATMKCTVWSVREDWVHSRMRAEGRYLTERYDDFARDFPALAELKEAAKAVAVVKWLKENTIAIDEVWAKTYPLAKAETPEQIRRFSVIVQRDENGTPEIAKE